jgi:hypothetical protein
MRGHRRRAFGALVVSLGVLFVLAPPAVAAAPANDSESRAVEVTGLPFTYEQDTTGANANGPRFCSNNTSVFFRFTASEAMRVQADTFGSDYDTVLGVYTRRGGRVVQKGCNDDALDLQSGVRFRAKTGVTYYFIVAQCCGSGDDYGGGNLVFTVTEVSDEPLEATMTVDATGTYDPDTGNAILSGTVTCSARSGVGLEGILRQVRQGLFVARGYVWAQVSCVPGDPVPWTTEVWTDTGIAFGPGSSRLNYWAAAWDGFGQYIQLADDVTASVDLTAP